MNIKEHLEQYIERLKAELADKDAALEWIKKDIMFDRSEDVIVTKINEVLQKYKGKKCSHPDYNLEGPGVKICKECGVYL